MSSVAPSVSTTCTTTLYAQHLKLIRLRETLRSHTHHLISTIRKLGEIEHQHDFVRGRLFHAIKAHRAPQQIAAHAMIYHATDKFHPLYLAVQSADITAQPLFGHFKLLVEMIHTLTHTPAPESAGTRSTDIHLPLYESVLAQLDGLTDGQMRDALGEVDMYIDLLEEQAVKLGREVVGIRDIFRGLDVVGLEACRCVENDHEDGSAGGQGSESDDGAEGGDEKDEEEQEEEKKKNEEQKNEEQKNEEQKNEEEEKPQWSLKRKNEDKSSEEEQQRQRKRKIEDESSEDEEEEEEERQRKWQRQEIASEACWDEYKV
ncbi:hypothetical protein QBC44DRAFT_125694 [Cladorrhinum sp. PSN332]|nr:hypothetical protein QBC44DRAFT_125694 [Cladorrhinum sp. PSN332]